MHRSSNQFMSEYGASSSFQYDDGETSDASDTFRGSDPQFSSLPPQRNSAKVYAAPTYTRQWKCAKCTTRNPLSSSSCHFCSTPITVEENRIGATPLATRDAKSRIESQVAESKVEMTPSAYHTPFVSMATQESATATNLDKTCERKSLRILGVDVWYPEDRKPFPPQVALTSKVINALTKSQNALLESPTGTGKTLALLTSTLAWQQANKDKEKCQIFFCSRTHSQLKQVARELENLHPNHNRSVTMCVLGSRNQLCTHKAVLSDAKKGLISINELCKEKLETFSCSLYFKHDRVKASLMSKRIWDIEDLLTIAKAEKGCAYFGARAVFETKPDILLAPYNYLIDPSVRASSRIDLKNSIVIFDEGHNLEDVCRSAASAQLSTKRLVIALDQLNRLANSSFLNFKKLREVVAIFLRWLHEFGDRLRDNITGNSDASGGATWGSTHNEWRGPEILDIWEGYAINKGTVDAYWEAFQQAKLEQEAVAEQMKERRQNGQGATQGEEKEERLELMSATTLIVLESLLTVLRFMLLNDGQFADAYRIVITVEDASNDNNREEGRDGYVVDFFCLSAAVAFSDLSKACRSVVVTSGTLSPLDSFAGELGVDFPVRLEASHVIDLSTQIYAAGVSSSYDVTLDSTYRNQQSPHYARALADALLTICQPIQGGILVFFPSYRLLNNMLDLWRRNGCLARLAEATGSEVFVEPRDSKDLDKLLAKYYEILDANVTVYGNSKHTRNSAVLFAVCRGKVSEGINFSDHYARAVVVIGIPFPAVNDTFVRLKRSYQDEKSALDREVHINGETWYKQQAFRAINQSIGRCIRHRYDFGAIILLDPRFHQGAVKECLSRWLRGAVTDVSCISHVTEPLQDFFQKFLPVTSVTSLAAAVDEQELGLAAMTLSAVNMAQRSNLYSSIRFMEVDRPTSQVGGRSIPSKYSTIQADLAASNEILIQFLQDCRAKEVSACAGSCGSSGGCSSSSSSSSSVSDGSMQDPSLGGPLKFSGSFVEVDAWNYLQNERNAVLSPSNILGTPSKQSEKQLSIVEHWIPEDGCVVRYLVIPKKLLFASNASSLSASNRQPIGRCNGLVIAMKILAVSAEEDISYLNSSWVLNDILTIQNINLSSSSSVDSSCISDVHQLLQADYRNYLDKLGLSSMVAEGSKGAATTSLSAVKTRLAFEPDDNIINLLSNSPDKTAEIVAVDDDGSLPQKREMLQTRLDYNETTAESVDSDEGDFIVSTISKKRQKARK